MDDDSNTPNTLEPKVDISPDYMLDYFNPCKYVKTKEKVEDEENNKSQNEELKNDLKIETGPWSEEENLLFMEGVKHLGKGKRKEIAQQYVKTRTRVQVINI